MYHRFRKEGVFDSGLRFFGPPPALTNKKKLPEELFLLGLAGEAKRRGHDVLRDVRELDFSVLTFIPADIVLESLEQPLGVFRSHNQAAYHLGFGNAGHHLHVVHYELAVRMSDDGEVGIDTLSNLRSKFDVEFFLRSIHSL